MRLKAAGRVAVQVPPIWMAALTSAGEPELLLNSELLGD